MRLRRARSDGGWRRLAILRLMLMSTIQTSNARPLVERWRDERCCGTKRGPVSTMAYSTVDDGWQDGQINSLGVSLSPSSNGGFFLRTILCFDTSPRLVQINHWTRVTHCLHKLWQTDFTASVSSKISFESDLPPSWRHADVTQMTSYSECQHVNSWCVLRAVGLQCAGGNRYQKARQ